MLTSGEQLKREGIALATANAGPEWSAEAMSYLRQFLALKKASAPMDCAVLFSFDEFHIWATEQGMPEPKSINAWGGVPKRAVREGLCEATGTFVKAGRAVAHAHLIRLWRAV